MFSGFVDTKKTAKYVTMVGSNLRGDLVWLGNTHQSDVGGAVLAKEFLNAFKNPITKGWLAIIDNSKFEMDKILGPDVQLSINHKTILLNNGEMDAARKSITMLKKLCKKIPTSMASDKINSKINIQAGKLNLYLAFTPTFDKTSVIGKFMAKKDAQEIKKPS